MQKIILISLALIALIANAQMQMQNTLNVTFNNEEVIVQWNYAPESIEFHIMSSLNGIDAGIEFSHSCLYFTKGFIVVTM